MTLRPDQRERYERNLLIPEIGDTGQQRLASARVCLVGLGGLGSSAGLYLAAAGVGALGLVDPDLVELSNLQRQVLHTTDSVGMPKTDSAQIALSALNPDVRLELHVLQVNPDNAAELLSKFDVIVEATDNFDSKFVINDACLNIEKPFATAGILALSGQALFVVPGRTPCLRCAVADVPQGVPTTAQQGVLGAVPGILGSLEAMEIIRWIVGAWKPQPDGTGLLHSIDGATMQLRTLRVPPRPGCRCARLWSN